MNLPSGETKQKKMCREKQSDGRDFYHQCYGLV
jgi:hypothetical protein